MVANLVEGVFSGNGRFGRYGTYLGGEAVLRLALSWDWWRPAYARPGPTA